MTKLAILKRRLMKDPAFRLEYEAVKLSVSAQIAPVAKAPGAKPTRQR